MTTNLSSAPADTTPPGSRRRGAMRRVKVGRVARRTTTTAPLATDRAATLPLQAGRWDRAGLFVGSAGTGGGGGRRGHAPHRGRPPLQGREGDDRSLPQAAPGIGRPGTAMAPRASAHDRARALSGAAGADRRASPGHPGAALRVLAGRAWHPDHHLVVAAGLGPRRHRAQAASRLAPASAQSARLAR